MTELALATSETTTQRKKTRKAKAKEKSRKKANKKALRTGMGGHDEVIKPSAERMARGEIVVDQAQFRNGNRRFMGVYRSRAECQLDIYRERGSISEKQFDAGMKFREAWLFQVIGIQTIDPSEPRGGSGSMENVFNKVAQSARFIREALAPSVLTLTQRLTLTRVCGQDQTLGEGHHIKILRLALDALVRLWKL